jgi:LacI family transcriptional regulator
VSPAGIKDVAARAGVSVGTVSNVLNQPHKVSETTRAKVEAAIVDLDFVRNEPARQLRAGSSRALAYLMLDAANPFFIDVARGVEEVARSQGLAVFLCTSDNDAGREDDYYELLLSQRVRGLLVTPVDAENPRLDWVVQKGVPVVLVDRIGEGALCSVSVDDVAGAGLAVGHLIENGHRRIAFVGGPGTLPQVQHRHEGSLAACRAAGLPESTIVPVATEALGVADGRRAGQHLAGLPTESRPTAAFCANDLVALGLLQEMTHLGTRVPEDLSIVGYDDIDFAAAAAVPLTSVRQPRHELGRTAAELLLSEGTEGHVHQQIEFAPELVIRASSGRAGDPAREDFCNPQQ